jgi:hypothetical protein
MVSDQGSNPIQRLLQLALPDLASSHFLPPELATVAPQNCSSDNSRALRILQILYVSTSVQVHGVVPGKAGFFVFCEDGPRCQEADRERLAK